MTSKTSKVYPTVYADTGAVAQHDGQLPVYRCNACQHEVVWATSKRTGRKYLANVGRGYRDQRFYIAASVHKCTGPIPGGHVDVLNDERDDDHEAEYDDFAAEQFATAKGLGISASGDYIDFAAEDIYWSNEFARIEREQEAAAFMADARTW